MNNKGFVVSTILYTILIAFLLFLAVTLSIFSSAISTVGGGTEDLVNATDLSIRQVVVPCDEIENWYDSDILAVITSKYGELYWPKDFNTDVSTSTGVIDGSSQKGSLTITCALDDSGSFESCDEIDIDLVKYLKVEDKNNPSSDEVVFGNICD